MNEAGRRSSVCYKSTVDAAPTFTRSVIGVAYPCGPRSSKYGVAEKVSYVLIVIQGIRRYLLFYKLVVEDEVVCRTGPPSGEIDDLDRPREYHVAMRIEIRRVQKSRISDLHLRYLHLLLHEACLGCL